MWTWSHGGTNYGQDQKKNLKISIVRELHNLWRNDKNSPTETGFCYAFLFVIQWTNLIRKEVECFSSVKAKQNQNKYTNAKIKGSMVPLIQKFIYDKDQSALRVGVYGLWYGSRWAYNEIQITIIINAYVFETKEYKSINHKLFKVKDYHSQQIPPLFDHDHDLYRLFLFFHSC